MKMRKKAVGLAALTVLAIATHAQAYEFGSGGWLQKPGLVIGATAAAQGGQIVAIAAGAIFTPIMPMI